MMNTAVAFLEANWERLELGHYGIPRHLSSVMVTPRFRASSHVVFLLLPPGESDPVLVAKVPRLAGASASIAREAENLRAVQRRLPAGSDSVPHLIAFDVCGDRHILVETALVGEPMDRHMIRRTPDACCSAVVDWLTTLQVPSRMILPDWFEQLVEEPLRRFETTFPLSDVETELLHQTRELTMPLRGIILPAVILHGDLSHPNILLLGNGHVGVVDWELAKPAGLPASDLFFFLTYAAFARHDASSEREYLEAFRAAFFEPNAWARAYVLAYAEQLQLPLRALTPLFVLSWAHYTVDLVQRLDAGAPTGQVGAQTAAWLRTNRYYNVWRYAVEHHHMLDWRDAGGHNDGVYS